MKSSEFITEAQVKPYKSKSLNLNAAMKLLNQHCRQSLAMIRNPIWRGMDNHSADILTIDPTTGERKSENTTNYYTQLMSYSPYFEGWPKRNKSLICTAQKEYAENYGGVDEVYAIFPFDNVPIAVCPEEDMWATPVRVPALDIVCDPEEDVDITEFNKILRYNLKLPENYKQMLNYVKTSEFAERLAQYRRTIPTENQKIPLSPETFIDYLQYCLSPKQCGFRLLSIAQYAAKPPIVEECWIGGPVVAIRQDWYYQFLDAVSKNPQAAGHKPFTPPPKLEPAAPPITHIQDYGSPFDGGEDVDY